MASVSIRKELSPEGGRYAATVEGIQGEAELTFTQRGPTLISADHTLAPESMRGTGAALALVQHMIADAREHGFKIVPICPYVRAQYRKHPDWRDVMTVDPE
jgi:predicted GNAT family acetyltransferase